ncbi:TIGR02678 family protein [Dehalobacterium formicoaceticum]|uniref:TIGR02678 family protein n=1 Tax=Dehalobacterium formicoaceticum TaxID=51515 RepID=UPI0031F6932D
MDPGTKKYYFDEIAAEVAADLLEQFWVLREREPEKYQMIREREQVLRTYFLDKLGFRLIVHRSFAKLGKIPVKAEAWMGIQDFIHPRDYGIFCCLLAFLEGKSVDEQFLLSHLCEDLLGLYPGGEGLDWTHYEHRKSLVRVLQTAVDIGILKVVDGDIADFGYREESEVLYEVPLVARYFMRSYPKDLFQFRTKEEILAAEWQGEEEDVGINRRHRVYRILFLSPVLYSKNADDPDFLYLRNYRNRIREDIESHSGFQFELYKNAALLTLPERRARFTLFPDNKAISDIALQFAQIVREQQQTMELPRQTDGSLQVTQVDFAKWVQICQERFGAGWSKQYREGDIPQIARDLLAHLIDWQMASRAGDTGTIILFPLLVRTVGKYPADFAADGE